MKRVFIVFALEGGKLIPHKHPVFTGDVAYDLGGEQEIQVCSELNVREFTGLGQIQAAVIDYTIQHSPESFEEIGAYYPIERFTCAASVKGKAKTKIVSKSKSK